MFNAYAVVVSKCWCAEGVFWPQLLLVNRWSASNPIKIKSISTTATHLITSIVMFKILYTWSWAMFKDVKKYVQWPCTMISSRYIMIYHDRYHDISWSIMTDIMIYHEISWYHEIYKYISWNIMIYHDISWMDEIMILLYKMTVDRSETACYER